jgi:hypothetical protein
MARPPAQDIRKASAAAERILGELCARSFGYTVEQKEGGWTLRVECATEDGWRVTILPVDPAELTESLRDASARERLRAAWRRRLRECACQGASETARS